MAGRRYELVAYENSVHADGDAPEYMLDMVRRAAPGELIVPRSTPVVAFGDPRTATVATLGINPSLWEYYGQDKAVPGGKYFLTRNLRRLPTLDVLGLDSMRDATSQQVRAVVEGCAAYFERNPYWRWFRVLQRLLAASTVGRYSYLNKGACHLDLVQWATDPIWGDLTPAVKTELLEEGVPHLRRQLEHHQSIQVVLLNGITAIQQATAVGWPTWSRSRPSCTGPRTVPAHGCTSGRRPPRLAAG